MWWPLGFATVIVSIPISIKGMKTYTEKVVEEGMVVCRAVSL